MARAGLTREHRGFECKRAPSRCLRTCLSRRPSCVSRHWSPWHRSRRIPT